MLLHCEWLKYGNTYLILENCEHINNLSLLEKWQNSDFHFYGDRPFAHAACFIFLNFPWFVKYWPATFLQNWSHYRLPPALKQSSSTKLLLKDSSSHTRQCLTVTEDICRRLLLHTTEPAVRDSSDTGLVSTVTNFTMTHNQTH